MCLVLVLALVVVSTMKLPTSLSHRAANRQLKEGKGGALLQKWGIGGDDDAGANANAKGDGSATRRNCSSVSSSNAAARLLDSMMAQQQRHSEGLGCARGVAKYGECGVDRWWEDAYAKAAAMVDAKKSKKKSKRKSKEPAQSSDSDSDSDSDTEVGARSGPGATRNARSAEEAIYDVGVAREALIGWGRCEGKLKRLMEHDKGTPSTDMNGRAPKANDEPGRTKRKREDERKNASVNSETQRRKKDGDGVTVSDDRAVATSRREDEQTWWFRNGFRRARRLFGGDRDRVEDAEAASSREKHDVEDERKEPKKREKKRRKEKKGFLESDVFDVWSSAFERGTKGRKGLGTKHRKDANELVPAALESPTRVKVSKLSGAVKCSFVGVKKSLSDDDMPGDADGSLPKKKGKEKKAEKEAVKSKKKTAKMKKEMILRVLKDTTKSKWKMKALVRKLNTKYDLDADAGLLEKKLAKMKDVICIDDESKVSLK